MSGRVSRGEGVEMCLLSLGVPSAQTAPGAKQPESSNGAQEPGVLALVSTRPRNCRSGSPASCRGGRGGLSVLSRGQGDGSYPSSASQWVQQPRTGQDVGRRNSLSDGPPQRRLMAKGEGISPSALKGDLSGISASTHNSVCPVWPIPRWG